MATTAIPADLLVEMTPSVRASLEGLLRQHAAIDELKAQVRRLAPKNTSVPPSTPHSHARPPRKAKPKSTRKCGGQRGYRGTARDREDAKPRRRGRGAAL